MEEQELSGGCLCGGVRFRAQGPWKLFVHCHCSRCRKATGTSHATNLFAAPERLEWTAGAECVKRFDLPSAQSFATCFCARCGGPVPHLTRSGAAWVIPAGCLDEPPNVTPEARIFWGSRATWTCSGDELPTFEGSFKR